MPGTNLTDARVTALKPRKTAYDNRYRDPGLIALCHDPPLLRLAPTATRGRPVCRSANRLLRFIRHPRSCPLNRMMDTNPAAIHDRSLSPNPAKPNRRSLAESYSRIVATTIISDAGTRHFAHHRRRVRVTQLAGTDDSKGRGDQENCLNPRIAESGQWQVTILY